jgi:hypothetical protein
MAIEKPTVTDRQAWNRVSALAYSILTDLLIVKHALYDKEIRLAQDTVDQLIEKLKAI